MEVKKPTTFDEQVEAIRSKGFIVEDEDFCKKVFGRINYYRFSAYLLPFRKPDKTYYSNVSFKQAYEIYEFDKKVRALILSAVEDIEVYLRTQLAYYHSHTYGPLGYLDKDNFNERHKQERFIQLIKDIIENNSSTLVVQHHIGKYGGKFPLWVIIECFSTGMLSYFFSDLLLEYINLEHIGFPQDWKKVLSTDIVTRKK